MVVPLESVVGLMVAVRLWESLPSGIVTLAVPMEFSSWVLPPLGLYWTVTLEAVAMISGVLEPAVRDDQGEALGLHEKLRRRR